MNLPIQLKKPLVFMDIEGTGTDPELDRMVELCLIKFIPEGKKEVYLQRLNPGIPIPPESTAIHGIEDKDVREMPFFRAQAPRVLEFLGPSDLAGYNVLRYDAPMLAKEMERAGLNLDLAGRRVVDMMKIFHKKEPRDLAAAFRFYCGKQLEKAHTAQADTEAVADVFWAQLKRYEDIPKDIAGLHEFCSAKDPRFVDASGRFAWRYAEACFNFGKHKGKSLRKVAEEEQDYLVWLVDQGKLPDDSWAICRAALEGEFPVKPTS